jgi:DNA-binding NtrC family response regulator
VILAEGPALRAGDVRALLHPAARGEGGAPGAAGLAGEREKVRQALIEADGDKRQAAELLGMTYRALLRKVREHDLGGVPRYRE